MAVDSTLEAQLQSWQERITTISRNLMELGEAETTRTVRARLKNAQHPYSGLTAGQAGAAITMLDGLWEDYVLLAGVIEKAFDLAKRSGLFHDNTAQIVALLNGPSVELPAIHVPLQSRGLLDASNQRACTTLAAVMEAMQHEFVLARDQIVRITKAESEARAQLDALDAEAASLKTWAASLGVELVDVEAVAQALANFNADPLSGALALDALASQLAGQRKQLQLLDAQRQAVATDLNAATQALEELKDLLQRSTAAVEESREKILEPQGLLDPMAKQALEPMQTWLNTLSETLAAGRWRSVKVGLAKWQADCDTYLAAERQRYAGNRAALDERADLRGRYKALVAKCQSYQQRGMSLDETLESLAQQTETALQARPFDLAAARRLVNSYETALYAHTNHYLSSEPRSGQH